MKALALLSMALLARFAAFSQCTNNIALGTVATASSVSGSSYAGLAVDGNGTSRWESVAHDPQWIYVDLGSVNDICKVTLQWEAAYGRNFSIDVSNNAVTWTTVRSITNNTCTLNNIPLSVTGRYIRMMGTSRATGVYIVRVTDGAEVVVSRIVRP